LCEELQPSAFCESPDRRDLTASGQHNGRFREDESYGASRVQLRAQAIAAGVVDRKLLQRAFFLENNA
jgi:hypothetical protein